MWAYVATGSGASAAATVNFNTSYTNSETVVNVVQLSGNNTTTPIAQSHTNSGSNSPTIGSLTSPNAANGEIEFVGVDGGSGTVLLDPQRHDQARRTRQQLHVGLVLHGLGASDRVGCPQLQPRLGRDRDRDQPRLNRHARAGGSSDLSPGLPRSWLQRLTGSAGSSGSGGGGGGGGSGYSGGTATYTIANASITVGAGSGTQGGGGAGSSGSTGSTGGVGYATFTGSGISGS